MRRKDLVVIGSGSAADHLLASLLARGTAERFNITLLGEEPGPSYARHQLGRVLRGAPPESLALRTPAWYAQQRITLQKAEVQRLDTAQRRVFCARGGVLHYDAAVLATGSVPKVPSIEGSHDDTGALRAGVHVLRSAADALAIRERARPGSAAIVLGGGLLGVEVAHALAELSAHVTLVHLGHGLVDRQLDFVAGQLLARRLEARGVRVCTGRTVEAALGSGPLTGVQLDDGEHLPADLLVIACGVRPRVEVARASGIPLNHGVLVNDALATQVPGVYAIGDCAEHQGKSYGMLGPALAQAAVLAEVLAGTRPAARYRGPKPVARLSLPGVEVAALGEVEPQLEGDQVLQVVEERRHHYRKLILREGRLVGATLLGDTRATEALLGSFERGEPLPSDPLEALRTPEAANPSTPDAAGVLPLGAVASPCNCTPQVRELLRTALSLGASAALLEQAEASGNLCAHCSAELRDELARSREPRLRRVPA